MPAQVSFLIDGFNLYHSLREIEGLAKVRVKWLNLHKLCESYLQSVRNGIGERVEIAAIHYFSALPFHLTPTQPGIVERQKIYLAAVESTGVSVVLSHFKLKDVACPRCRNVFKRAEEKETDVAIGTKLIEVLATSECQTVVLITGDTDLIPAIRTAKHLFPDRKIGVGFPFMRHNANLKHKSDYHFQISQKVVQNSQFPTQVRLANGTVVTRPPTW